MGLLCIAFSDLHAYKFKQFNVGNSRLDYTMAAAKEIFNRARAEGVPILFAGDLYHTPKELESETLTTMQIFLSENLRGTSPIVYAISGNHDQNEKNGWDYRANSYLKGIYASQKNFVLLDYLDGAPTKDFLVQGIPYMNSEDEIKKAVDYYRPIAKRYRGFKILLMHGDVLGAKDHNGLEMYDGKLFKNGVDNFFKEWDLVLYGHIHKAQKITKKVYMLGSPIHQISSDKGEMGYWEIYNDRDPIFIGLANYPKFIHLGQNESLPDGGKDYYIPFEKEESIEGVEQGNFNMNVSRTKMAKRYLKAKGIKSKIKRRELIHILNSIE